MSLTRPCRLWPAILMAAVAVSVTAEPLPEGFVHLQTLAPEIVQDMRYHGAYNFIGQPIDGYLAPSCILTRQAAEALQAIQTEVSQQGLRVKVFDCYRPTRAVAHFVHWSQDVANQRMKLAFYSRWKTNPFPTPISTFRWRPPATESDPACAHATVFFSRRSSI